MRVPLRDVLTPAIDTPLYDVTVTSGVGALDDLTPTAGEGVWTILIDYSSATGAGSVSLSQT